MLIDWFTVGAQTLNFLVLVWLLKRFLYGPILAAIDAREARIRAEIDSAAATRADAQREQCLYRQRLAELDGQRQALLDAAAADAQAQRTRLIDEARRDADALSRTRRQALAREATRLGDALRRQTGEEVMAISRTVLAELADTELEERIAARFLRALGELPTESHARLAHAIATEGAVIRSTLALPAVTEETLRAAIAGHFETTTPVHFEVDAELIGGIELSAGGFAVSWTIAAWLDRLQSAFDALLSADMAAPDAGLAEDEATAGENGSARTSPEQSP